MHAMNVTLLDDYQDVVRTLDCFAALAAHTVTVFNDPAPDTEVLVQRLQDAEVLLLFRERTALPRAVLLRLPRLRFISLVGPVPHVDLQACTELGITVSSRMVTARPSYATAELTWGLVLAAWRRIPQEMAHLQAGGWQSPHAVGSALRGRTLGIYGYGRIGALVAGYGRAFGMRVIAWGREGSLARAAAEGVEAAASEQALFAESDVLSLHLGLNEATRGVVRREHLAAMKPTALLVNTSRAPLIEEGRAGGGTASRPPRPRGRRCVRARAGARRAAPAAGTAECGGYAAPRLPGARKPGDHVRHHDRAGAGLRPRSAGARGGASGVGGDAACCTEGRCASGSAARRRSGEPHALARPSATRAACTAGRAPTRASQARICG